MKGKLLRSAIFVAAITVCSLPLAAHADSQTYQTANVVQFGTGIPLGGAATLFRSKHEIWAHAAASGLDQNAAYTVWWILFNNPSACVGGCGADDLVRPEARASVLYAAGFVTGDDGTVNVSAHLEGGDPALGVEVRRGSGLERNNGFGAEVHIILRGHGPIIPGRVAEQIGTFAGACDVNVCTDQQAAAFLPVQ